MKTGETMTGSAAKPEPTGEMFDPLFTAVAASPTLRRIWRDAFGAEYVEEVDPFSFVTAADLKAIETGLNVSRGKVLVDLACGRGGPGLWLARMTGVSLIGVDFSSVGVAHASARAREMGIARAEFFVADAASTKLADRSVDAVMSIDALQLMPELGPVLAETARILKVGARLAFTTWEFPVAPAWRPTAVADYRPFLEEAGFSVVRYEETPRWREFQSASYRGILGSREALAGEMGEIAKALVEEAERYLASEILGRRILAVAERAR